MKCAKCGFDLPAGSNVCPNCGPINEFEGHQKKKISPLIYVIAVLFVLGLASIVAAMVFMGRNRPGNVTVAPPPSPNGGAVMVAPPPLPGQDTVNPTVQQGKQKPPKEVSDYLDFVKKVEEHRQTLLKDTSNAYAMSAAGQSQGLMDMIDMAMDPDGEKARDPLADTKKELNRQYKNWLETLKFFDSKPAPTQCGEFSDAYRAVIYGEAKAIGEVAVSFNDVNIMNSDGLSKLMASLQKMKSDPNIQGNIDKSADTADGKLSALVSNYDMQKPFTVQREQPGGGSVVGF